jgi:hypothetical protein
MAPCCKILKYVKNHCCYIPKLMHGAEIWAWINTDVSRLTPAEMRFLRRIQGVTKVEKLKK